MGIEMGMMCNRNAVSGPEGPLTWGFVERTTRFEPATLTLAKNVVGYVR